MQAGRGVNVQGRNMRYMLTANISRAEFAFNHAATAGVQGLALFLLEQGRIV